MARRAEAGASGWSVLKGELRGRDEDQPGEAQLLAGGAGDQEVTEMHRIKGSTV